MFIKHYIKECHEALSHLDCVRVEQAILILKTVQETGGRLFVLGVGGSAANASHAVNDFRKLCNIEAYCPSDNVSELTAISNDEGFDFIFQRYLECSRLTSQDAILILSVGGGCLKNKLSVNLIKAIDYAKKHSAQSIAILGKDTGYAASHVDVPILVPIVDKNLITPISEAMQGLIWHALVSDPRLQRQKSTWAQIDEQCSREL